MRTLREIEVLLLDKLYENKQSIQEYDEKIQEAEKSKEQADTMLLKAENTVNVDEYNEAKNAIWSADHAKELYLKQQKKLKQEALVTKTEYNQLLAEITQVANALHEEQNKRAVALIIELKEIADESSKTWQQANELMQLLQRKVYKEPEGKIPAPNGGTTWSTNKQYRNTETVHDFYQMKIHGTSFAERAGDKEKPAARRYWG